MKTRFYLAAHGVIRQDDKILTTRRSQLNDYKPGLWDFPGGKLEAGESPEEALRREIQEEVKLEVGAVSTNYIFTHTEELPEVQYFLLVYECEYMGGDVILDPEEHDDHKWASIDELQEMDMIHFVKGWLEHQKSAHERP